MKVAEWKEHTPVHILPVWRSGYRHRASPGCFCRPRRATSPSGFSIYVHDWKFLHFVAIYEGEPVPVRWAPKRKKRMRLVPRSI